ncbi:MAG TPA: hypothetical protein VMU54_11960 [Planctomycetota bacterium]|nr:hypothetical protein [Planctomycetota bacterium]
MKPARWAILAGGVLVAAAAILVLRPRSPEPFPLAELVPANAVFYAGFPRYQELEDLPGPWARDFRRNLEPFRPHLAGGLALYVDRSGEWVALARLTRGSALLAGTEVENGAAVVAQTPQALARHRAREGSLAELPEFKKLGSRFFFNLEPLKLRGRFRDFSAIGVNRFPDADFVLRGRALYRGGLFRTYLEQYVQAPRHGVPGGPAAARVALTEHFPRVWEELTHDVLDLVDTEKAEREAQILSRDFLEGRSFREFLGRLGPSWGWSIATTPFGKPALVVWIDLPEDGARDLAAKMVHRAIGDAIKLRRDRGLPPSFEVVADGPLWRIKSVSARGLRYGEAYSPAYTFEKNRFVFSTCSAVMDVPPTPEGHSHAEIRVEVPELFNAIRSLAPMQADDTFRVEAERKASILLLRLFDPGMLVSLKKQFPDPADLANYQETQRAQFEARALDEISKTLAWQEELTRARASIEAWAEGLSWLARVSVSSRFTSEGLDFELRLEPRPR